MSRAGAGNPKGHNETTPKKVRALHHEPQTDYFMARIAAENREKWECELTTPGRLAKPSARCIVGSFGG
jgi:hypothetical protein